MAERGIAELQAGLPGAAADGQDADSREQALTGAWLAGATFAVAGSSLHHKLCHVLGGRFDLPHAETHSVVLPHVTQLAVRHMPEAGALIARALDADDPVAGLRELGSRLDAPTSLGQYGLTAEGAAAVAADLDPGALGTPFPVTREELQALLAALV